MSKKDEVIALLNAEIPVKEIVKQTGLTEQYVYKIRRGLKTATEKTEKDSPVEIEQTADSSDNSNSSIEWIDSVLKEATEIIMDRLRNEKEIHKDTVNTLLFIAELVGQIHGATATNERRTALGTDTDRGEDVGGTTPRLKTIMEELEKGASTPKDSN